jgi:WD40 repeat protein
MRKTLSIVALTLTTWAVPTRAADAPKVTYQDHVLPVFRNTCLNCHNPDKKKGGLDLSNYAAMSAGGGSGKAVEPGDPDSSKLFKAVTWAEEPNMPPKGDKLPDKDIALIKAWIAGGAPETSGSTVVINKPKNNLAVVTVAGKPTGPVAMPKDLSIEPVAVTKHPAALTALAASPWAPLIAIGGQRQIVLYNSDTLDLVGILPYPEGIAYSLKFSQNGSLLLAGGGVGAKTGKVVAFDVATGNRVAEVGDEFDAVITADVSPDQTQVALGTPLRSLKIYNTSDGSVEHAIKKHTDWVQAVAYSPSGKYLASGDRAGGLWVWEARTARELYNCSGHKEGVTDACFRGDSNILASASQDGTIKLWNMSDGTMAKTIQAHAGGVLSVAFTHDGRLVSCGRDRVVKLWAPDGAPLKSFEPFGDIALRAALSYDGNRVVAGDYSGAIRVWNVADGKRAGELTANPPTVQQQLAGLDQRLKDLKATADKAAADLKGAQDAAAQTAADLKAANDAQAAATKAIAAAQSKLDATTAEVTKKARSAKESIGAKQSAAEAAAAVRSKAKSALETAVTQLASAKTKLEAAKTAAEEATASAQRAKTRAEAAPDDKELAAKAQTKAKTAAEKAAAIEELNKQVGAKNDEVKSRTTALTKAEADAKSSAAALADAKAASKLSPENSPEVTAAKQAVAKAKADLEAATKAIAAKTPVSKTAAERLAKLQADAKTAAEQLEAAKGQRSRLEAALAKQPAKVTKS